MTSLKKKNNNENLLKAISFLRLDLTMEELGEKLDYKKSTISKYITGSLPPSNDFLNKFEEVFNINLNDFETKQPETKTPEQSQGDYKLLHEVIKSQAKQIEFLQEMLLKK